MQPVCAYNTKWMLLRSSCFNLTSVVSEWPPCRNPSRNVRFFSLTWRPVVVPAALVDLREYLDGWYPIKALILWILDSVLYTMFMDLLIIPRGGSVAAYLQYNFGPGFLITSPKCCKTNKQVPQSSSMWTDRRASHQCAAIGRRRKKIWTQAGGSKIEKLST